jgi:preprotein translocase subunit SecF
MTIIMIGLVADVFNTWVQNSGILRLYLERRGHHSDDA